MYHFHVECNEEINKFIIVIAANILKPYSFRSLNNQGFAKICKNQFFNIQDTMILY